MIRKINWGLIGALLFCLSFWAIVAFAWTYTYDTATPAGSDDPAEADDRMREIKLAIQEVMDVEHDWALTGTALTGDGKHTDITTDSITNAGALANTGNLAVNTDKFTVTAASGNTLVAGTLDVTGVAILGDASLLKTSAAPTADASLTNKKYVDDRISAALPDDDAFGSWASKSNDTVYQAATDGFVIAYKAGDADYLAGYTDGSNPPTTLRVRARGLGGNQVSITMPVKKSDYWKVVKAGNVWWMPIGA